MQHRITATIIVEGDDYEEAVRQLDGMLEYMAEINNEAAGTEPDVYTFAGHTITGNGAWHTDSDHSDREDAARRVAFLNGGHNAP